MVKSFSSVVSASRVVPGFFMERSMLVQLGESHSM